MNCKERGPPEDVFETLQEKKDSEDEMGKPETRQEKRPPEDEIGKSESQDEKEQKTKLYWLDSEKDEIFFKAFASIINIEELTKDDVNSIEGATDEERKIIIICRRSSYRLENMLDFYLKNADENIFKRVSVIFVHNSSLGERPLVSSRFKLGESDRYKRIQNITDVCYHAQTNTTSIWKNFASKFYTKLNPEIIFGKEEFLEFLRIQQKFIPTKKGLSIEPNHRPTQRDTGEQVFKEKPSSDSGTYEVKDIQKHDNLSEDIEKCNDNDHENI